MLYKAGLTKPFIRDKAYTYLNNCSRIFTLPNLDFSLEERFIEDDKLVECAERDTNIFKKQLGIKPDNLFIYNNDIKDINLSIYDGLFLDMCGSFSLSVGEALNSLKSDTRIVLTLQFARETTLFQRCFPNFDKNDRVESYISILNYYKFMVDYSIEYTDNRSPMGVLFAKKI